MYTSITGYFKVSLDYGEEIVVNKTCSNASHLHWVKSCSCEHVIMWKLLHFGFSQTGYAT